jgi:hypothetical protein
MVLPIRTVDAGPSERTPILLAVEVALLSIMIADPWPALISAAIPLKEFPTDVHKVELLIYCVSNSEFTGVIDAPFDTSACNTSRTVGNTMRCKSSKTTGVYPGLRRRGIYGIESRRAPRASAAAARALEACFPRTSFSWAWPAPSLTGPCQLAYCHRNSEVPTTSSWRIDAVAGAVHPITLVNLTLLSVSTLMGVQLPGRIFLEQIYHLPDGPHRRPPMVGDLHA